VITVLLGERIAELGLNNGPLNLVTRDLLRAFNRALADAAARPEIRCLIVHGGQARAFCAGSDIKEFAELRHDASERKILFEDMVLRRLAQMPMPTIAAIDGPALGGGLEIALACDLRFGARGGYRIGLPEVTLGLLPGNGGTQRLPRLIGASRALDLMVTGRPLSPGEAHAAGILNRLLPAAELESATRDYAGRLAGGATRAIGEIKLAIREGIDRPLADGLAREREGIRTLFGTADAAEGMGAFVEKRKPEFKGA
jgi:enoyl-CoA hydratase/carnithine racemase